MSRSTVFANSNATTVAGTSGNDEDIVSVTGRGIIDYIVVKAVTNPSNIDYYVLEIDGTPYNFDVTLPFPDDLGLNANLDTANFQYGRKIVFNSSFKLQAHFNATVSVDFKHSISYFKDN